MRSLIIIIYMRVTCHTDTKVSVANDSRLTRYAYMIYVKAQLDSVLSIVSLLWDLGLWYTTTGTYRPLLYIASLYCRSDDFYRDHWSARMRMTNQWSCADLLVFHGMLCRSCAYLSYLDFFYSGLVTYCDKSDFHIMLIAMLCTAMNPTKV